MDGLGSGKVIVSERMFKIWNRVVFGLVVGFLCVGVLSGVLFERGRRLSRQLQNKSVELSQCRVALSEFKGTPIAKHIDSRMLQSLEDMVKEELEHRVEEPKDLASMGSRESVEDEH